MAGPRIKSGGDPAIHAAPPQARRSVWRDGDGDGPHPAFHAPPMDARIKSGHDDAPESSGLFPATHAASPMGAVSREASGGRRSPPFGPRSGPARVGVRQSRTCYAAAEHGERGEEVANAAVVHVLAPFGLRLSPAYVGAIPNRGQYRYVRIPIRNSDARRNGLKRRCGGSSLRMAPEAFRNTLMPSGERGGCDPPGAGHSLSRSIRRYRPLAERRSRSCALCSVAR